MIQLIFYTIYIVMRCGILIGDVLRLFPGALGILLGANILSGAIIEYFLFLTMIRKISELEKK